MTDNKLTDEGKAYMNTDVELFREPSGPDFSAPKCFRTQDFALGINAGGTVFVRTLRAWHELAKAAMEPSQLRAPKLTDEDEMIAAAESVKRQCFEARHHGHHGTLLLTASSCIGSLLDKLRAPVAQRADSDAIAQWLDTPEGKAAVANAVTLANEAAERLADGRRIDPVMLNTPFAATSAPAEREQVARQGEPVFTDAQLDELNQFYLERTHHFPARFNRSVYAAWPLIYTQYRAPQVARQIPREHESAYQQWLAVGMPYQSATQQAAVAAITAEIDKYLRQYESPEHWPELSGVNLMYRVRAILAALPLPGVSPAQEKGK